MAPLDNHSARQMHERALALPSDNADRATMVADCALLLEAIAWINEQPNVAETPACLFALLGLAENHLLARLIHCEERVYHRPWQHRIIK